MKQICAFLFLLNLGCCAMAQTIDNATIECQYKLAYIADTLHPERRTEDFMVLKIGKAISDFYSYNTFRADSLMQADASKGLSAVEMLANKARYGKSGMGYHIFKNYPQGKITVTEKIVNDYYKYQEPLPPLQWKLTDEKTNILNYSAQKATCTFGGRQYEAWFTTEVPLNAGPWKFSGLPGLILKVEDTQHQYLFEIAGLQKTSAASPVELANKPYINLTKGEFLKLQEKFRKDPVAYLNSNGGVTVKALNTDNSPKRERPYNPIERL